MCPWSRRVAVHTLVGMSLADHVPDPTTRSAVAAWLVECQRRANPLEGDPSITDLLLDVVFGIEPSRPVLRAFD